MAKTLKEKLAEIIPKLREERKLLATNYSNETISQVTVAQALGGMRGVKGMVCDTSVVEPDKGLIIRGYPILKLKNRLPEEIFWLLITGVLPSSDELKLFQKELKANREVPKYVWKVIKAMPKSSHPMAILDTAILTMENESVFRKRYREGMKRTEYWEAALVDAMKIISTIHTIAAGIYRIKYKKGSLIEPSKKLDWAADYTRMLGLPPKKGQTYEMMRLYLTLHSDHEGGNVSANTCHTVGSALSDPFYAVSAGLNGLAGPLHGLANQECLRWILETMEEFGGAPTDEQIEQHTWDTLNAGKVIPGYGHAVLRVTDPR
ncbi:MAG: citrate (Si)-synthase, partial [Candidatus Zixiibacteriota bacterium]